MEINHCGTENYDDLWMGLLTGTSFPQFRKKSFIKKVRFLEIIKKGKTNYTFLPKMGEYQQQKESICHRLVRSQINLFLLSISNITLHNI